MKKTFTVLAVMICIGLLAGGTLLAQIKPDKKLCCIAGTYNGKHQAIKSKTCPEPDKGSFTMQIFQEFNCGSKLKGKIVDSSGDVMLFEGTLYAGPDKCCTMKGIAKKTGESVEIKAVMCQNSSGKWYSKSGEYIHSNGCSGTFSIVEQ